MEKLVVFKIENDELFLCGFFNSRDEVLEYLKEIKKLMDEKMQHHLKGEYIAMPILYFHLLPTEITKK